MSGVGRSQVDLGVFDEMNKGGRGKRTPWEQRVELIRTHFPSVVELDWKAAFDRDIDMFAWILQDVLKADQAEPGRSGPKPGVAQKAGVERLRQLFGDDYSHDPFCETFLRLAGERSLSALAARTKLSRSHVNRLLKGIVPPTAHDMEQIAHAFKKEPGYFLEYRADVVLSALANVLLTVPEASVRSYRKLQGIA